MNQFLDFDQKLYAELRKGSEHAFVTVFERYNRLLYALAYRYFKSGAACFTLQRQFVRA